MEKALMIILAVISVLMIVVILLQPSKSDGFSGSISGGAEQLFGTKRARGYETILHHITVVLAIAFIVISLAAVALAS